MKKCVMVLLPNRLACFAGANGTLVLDREWPIDGADLPTGLNAYLDENCDAEFSLFLDLPEEECHLEKLNTTGLRDRKYLIERFKNKRFENSLLSKASVAGQRKNVSLVLSGVDASLLCENLLQLLEKKYISLRAIHSAITLAGAISKLAVVHKGSNLFVIRLQGCYRLIASRDSVVLFTRRVSVGREGANSNNAVLLNKSLEETLVYVQRLQPEPWMPRLVLFGFTSQPTLSHGLEEFAEKSSLVEQVLQYRSPVDSVNSAEAEVVLATAAMRCGNGYAQRQHRRMYMQRKVRNVTAALALCGVCGAISSVAIANKLNGSHAVIAESYSQSALSFSDDVAAFESNYEQPVEAVRQALVTAKLVEFGSVYKPVEFLQSVAEDVQRHPDVTVSSVRWELDELVNGPSIVGLLSQSVSVEKLHLEQIYHATVAGAVEGRPESALSEFEAFVSALRTASSDPTVVVVETPFGLGGQSRATMNDFLITSGGFVLEVSNQGAVQ